MTKWTQDEAEWEKAKSAIRRHYLEEGKSLNELAQTMRKEYRLNATYVPCLWCSLIGWQY
jgi:hypothetical protein